MNAVTTYLKAHVALVLAVTTWLVTALKDGQISGQEWAGLPIAVLTGLGVAVVANKPKPANRAHKQAGYTAIDALIFVVVAVIVVLLIIFLANHVR